MYSHVASNDSTESLNFTQGWFTSATVALKGGAYAAYGTSKGQAWIDLDTDAGLIRLVGVSYVVQSGTAPANDASYYYLPVWPKSYIQVAVSATVDRVFSHTHQTSFDNVYGSGTKPTLGEIWGKRPIDLLATNVGYRVDGTAKPDFIILNDAGGVAYSNDGKDTVVGGSGPDLMFGGRGKDFLQGMGGADTINGDNGNDALYGGGDDDELRGGAGKDTLFGGDGQDRLLGEWQDDVLFGEGDNDALYGGDNNDSLFGGAGEDALYGGNDKDMLYGDADNDVLYGGNHDDRLWGGVAQDELHGDAGNDRLYGDTEDDTLFGDAGNDRMWGGDGQDHLDGGKGNDQLYGEADNDWLSGGKGNDRLYGGAGDGSDWLYGGAGNDRLDGGNGYNRLDGGPGNDILKGGGGTDEFVFSSKLGGGNVDRVAGFTVGTDNFQLSSDVFKKLPVGPLPADYFHRGSGAADKSDHIIYDAGKGLLIYDRNGSAKGGDQVFAKVQKGLDLHHSDFYVF